MVDVSTASLAGTVLVSSLLGSAHCAGMCGGMALAASGPQGLATGSSGAARQVGYHIGRLASYATVGALAGFAGSAVDDAGVLVGVQRIAAIVAGCTIALFGVAAIARAAGARVPKAGVPRPLISLAQRVHGATLRLPPQYRGLPVGLATPLLPCGWLYAFAAIAAGSASITIGALVMVSFWLGTVPALVLVASGARAAFARMGRLAPAVAGLAMVVVGLHAAFVRAGVAESAMTAARASSMSQSELSGSELVVRAEAQAAERPACCKEKP